MNLIRKIPTTNKPVTSPEIKEALVAMADNDDFMKVSYFVSAEALCAAPVIIESQNNNPSRQIEQLADMGHYTYDAVPNVEISLGKSDVTFKDIIDYYIDAMEAMQEGICYEFSRSSNKMACRSTCYKTGNGMFLRIRLDNAFKLFYIGWLGNELNIEKMIKLFTQEGQWHLIALADGHDFDYECLDEPVGIDVPIPTYYSNMIDELNAMHILSKQTGVKEGLNQEALKELIARSNKVIESVTALMQDGITNFGASSV